MAPTIAKSAPAAPPRTRPKDRRQHIAMAAALAFSERGYHQVSLSDVADAVGISAPALYRHFPNKYALFVDAAQRLAHGLIEATDAVEVPEEPDTARERLDALLNAIIAKTIENRRTGGLYRWEGRYLERPERDRLRDEFARLRASIRRPLEMLRPELDEADADMLATAALSVVASITTHRTTMAQKPMTELLIASADRILAADLPAPADAPFVAETGLTSSAKRETMIRESISLFYHRGYHETSVEDISAAVGITASGFYRHFASKSEILLEACVRAAERLSATAAGALASAGSSGEALSRLVDSYVDYSFVHHELVSVYFSDVGALDKVDQTRLQAIQRDHVDEWVALLQDVRPDRSASAARFLVHAGLTVVVDVGRTVRFDGAPETRARVGTLVRASIGVE
ncbi:TetR/AcrR family transcriptional regulator [Microbacterium thalassium]|uniref:AcrR family transcriptional regulator n=1 Tax=Microbacterium thalassium TaxID=362649 RepID=A0A7X0FN79_9MICO|nr:TetR/AcrR family transcriptional regulator [Microbacterium thalassium]MBB6390620.1 AcrR family transcriptional regulator [Microbacterium thalassium]